MKRVYDRNGVILKQYELLSDEKPDAARLEEMLSEKGRYYRTKTTTSGNLKEVQIYPVIDTKKSAALKRVKPTKQQQDAYNEKKSRRELIRFAEANFGDEDYFLTLTKSGEELPDHRAMKKLIAAYIRRVNRERARRGIEGTARYICTVEGHEDGDRRKRVHAHILIDHDIDRDTIEKLWREGLANCKRVQGAANGGLSAIAAYMGKGKKAKSEKAWWRSRNLKKPTERTADRKATAHRVWQIANGGADSRSACESLYKGFEVEGEIEARQNAHTGGIYIYFRMRRKGAENRGARIS